MDLARLDNVLAEAGEPAYRARQVWAWAARGAGGYDGMTDLPARLREGLAGAVPFSTLTMEREAHASDGVSSQSGCPLTCTFCATGQMRFGRNLTEAEILDQVLHFRRIEPVTISCSWAWASRS